jgi:guanylate kinase
MTRATRAPRTVRPTVALVLICGPTCAGKSTLAKTLVDRYPSAFVPIVTTTTRAPRPGETDGRHYHFASLSAFEKNIAEGKMVEYDQLLPGTYYGLERQELLRIGRTGRIGVAVVTPAGIGPIRAACASLGKRVVTVYVAARPAVLASRLLTRYRADREDSVSHYSDRLLQMLESFSAWRPATYQVSEPDFGPDTLEAVLQRIHHSIEGENTPYTPATHLRVDRLCVPQSR